MTNEEALKRFKWKYNLTKDYNDPHWEGGERREHSEWVEQLEIAINALEKQIPKKVELYKHNGDFKWENYPCPCCGEMLGLEINKRYVKFCPNCGQALDWSDTE